MSIAVDYVSYMIRGTGDRVAVTVIRGRAEAGSGHGFSTGVRAQNTDGAEGDGGGRVQRPGGAHHGAGIGSTGALNNTDTFCIL